MSTGVPGTEQPEPGLDGQLADGFVLRLLLGAQLRRFREAAGITPEQAGHEIRASRSKISRMETGHVGFKKRDINDLLTLYGVTDEQQRSRILSIAEQASQPDWWNGYSDVLPGWFENYLGLESAAATIRSFETQFVPGLFQTEDYARAVTQLGHQASSADEIGRRVGLRLKRQHLLDVVYVEQLTSALYLEQRSDVEHYLEVMDRLSSEALTPAETVGFIEQAAKET
jgi:transcriptional regulator with XRE-family HTH domain